MPRQILGLRPPLDVAHAAARPASARVGAVLQGKGASWSDLFPLVGIVAGGIAGYYSNAVAPIASAIVGSFSGLLAGAVVEERLTRGTGDVP